MPTITEKGVEVYDVVIIGAGLYGIQAARTYLDIHPDANLCILEGDEVVGGTWSEKRIYPAFWTQTPHSMAEFSDRPLPAPPPTDQYYGFFAAHHVTSYLSAYVDNHIYDDQSLRDRILFSTWVERIERTEEGRWKIFVQRRDGNGDREGNENGVIETAKLIDASGMTSSPNIPHFPGQEHFQGKIIHHRSFGLLPPLTSLPYTHIAVLGGAKSAADVAYSFAKAGKQVSWIIREDGAGPAALLSAEGKGWYRNSNEGFYTRFVAAFLPNPFGNDPFGKGGGWLGGWLQGTRVGRWLVAKFWRRVDTEHRLQADYGRVEGRGMGFGELEPDTPIFWQNDSSGVNQRPDFYPTIARKVHVYRQNIDCLSKDSVTLAAGKGGGKEAKTLTVDLLVLCTGWNPLSTIYSTEQARQLGLPVKLEQGVDDVVDEKQKGMEQVEQDDKDAEDQKILDRFPVLRNPPRCRKAKPSHTPFRLYKAMVPEKTQDSRSIVFLGKMVVGNNFLASEVQALWAVAYLDGNIKLDHGVVKKEIDETLAWCRKRYLSKGDLGSWFYFDVVDYIDMLMAQLGLESHRQKGWLRNLFAPCKAADLRNLVDEYRVKYPQA